jgi:hypothetical protein
MAVEFHANFTLKIWRNPLRLEYHKPRWVSLSRLAFGRPTANLPDKACPANATVSPMTIHRFAELFAGVVVLIWCGQFLLDFLHNRQSK